MSVPFDCGCASCAFVMILLLLGLAALFLGPLCAAWLTRFRQAQTVLDAFVVVAIGGLVLFHIIPESIEQVGWPAIAAVAVGLIAPMLVHGPQHDAHHDCRPRRTQPLVLLAGLAMGLHAFFDGVALAPTGATPSVTGSALLRQPLAWAAILHRALEGTGIWWLLRPHWGRMGAALAMLALGGATIFGFWSMHWAVILGAESQMACLQACAAGSLLHVLLHHTDETHGHAKGSQAWPRSLGTLLGLLLLLALAYLDTHHHHHGHTAHDTHVHDGHALAYWVRLGGGIAPYVLLGWLGLALTHAFIPQVPLLSPSASQQQGLVRRGVYGALLGMFAETPLPKVAALYRHADEHRFSKKALSVADLVFLLASSAWGLNAWILGGRCFGIGLTTLCGFLMGLAAVGLGILLWRVRTLQRSSSHEASPKKVCVATQPQLGNRFADGLDFAIGEGANALAPWLVWGIWLAAMVAHWCDRARLLALAEHGYDIWLLAALAYPVYLHPIATILTALALWQKGITLGAVITFVLANAVTAFLGLESVLQLKSVYRRCIVVLWVGGLCPLVGYLINASALQLHPWELAEDLTLGQWLALLVVGCGILGSCLRQGIRKFLEPITAWNLMLGQHQHHHDV